MPPRSDWGSDSLLTGDPVFTDSLELVTLAGMFSDAYGITHSGLDDLLLGRPSVARWVEILDRSLGHWQEEIGFFTSGSTGQPRRVSYPLSLLIQEVEVFISRLSPLRRIVTLVDSHHIYGFLFGFLLPEIASVPLLRVSPLGLAPEPGDLVVTVPQILQGWKARGFQWPKGVRLLTSTAPLGPEEARWLKVSEVDYLEIYGSSETAGIGTRSSLDQPFTLLPYWSRGSGDGMIERSDLKSGRIQRELPDTVEWKDDQSLLPKGRKDMAVQVGGHNVYPREVAGFLEGLSEVTAARVRLFESSQGPRLKAFVIPEDTKVLGSQESIQALEQKVRTECGKNLPSPQRPIRYSFGATLPTTEIGKEADWD